MKDKQVQILLLTTILAVQLMKVWADKRFHDKYDAAIAVIQEAIDKDYSRDMLFFVFVQFEIIMNKPVLPSNPDIFQKGGEITGKQGKEIVIPNTKKL